MMLEESKILFKQLFLDELQELEALWNEQPPSKDPDRWTTSTLQTYFAKIKRHEAALYSGQFYDRESGKPHIYHIVLDWLVLSKLWRKRIDERKKRRETDTE